MMPRRFCVFFDHLLAFIDHAVDRQFLDADHRSLLLASDDPEQLLNLVHCWIRPDFDKATWIREVNAGSQGGRCWSGDQERSVRSPVAPCR